MHELRHPSIPHAHGATPTLCLKPSSHISCGRRAMPPKYTGFTAKPPQQCLRWKVSVPGTGMPNSIPMQSSHATINPPKGTHIQDPPAPYPQKWGERLCIQMVRKDTPANWQAKW